MCTHDTRVRQPRRRLAGLLLAALFAGSLTGCASCADWERVYNPICQL
jgi:hypothetical protein